MTKTRTGDAFMPADDYGRALPKFSVNLLVRSVEKSLPFYRDILGATVRYADGDFAALALLDVDFMLHADHTYDHHPLYERLRAKGRAEPERNCACSASIPMHWKRAQGPRAQRSCGPRRIFRMAGAKSCWWIPMDTSGPWACRPPKGNEAHGSETRAPPWIRRAIVTSCSVLRIAGESAVVVEAQ